MGKPLGANAWQQLAVRSESVEIITNTGQQAVGRAIGTSADHPGLTVVTTYTANADEQWITAETEFRNTTAIALPVWVGDAMD
ncbi:hypothetical protein [Cryobacterium sp. Y82]|uniref:hypothetical protein n=1 Tax=Cryobacterium sp. Y82 TaxID=2045017 RepID=UPI000CE2EB45|nr:hypothetical protein [Cryobacterium sp. Y82]